ncbi:single-stranded DNA-binding protein [Synechococcus sp. ATX 2A4]|uniref:single-stranded DNA-binding protein n=1 Tax=Synechococcus sp. ATX 2A4 TaxID=2823727 RepID=UPI0020CC2100|nr:single-stranded DNA-binding protein [Synechococcus sp. ATX 2A4]MCP9883950.1 single-stranded DNA-binding protein [Synechococcus sp. ATX 2A4]
MNHCLLEGVVLEAPQVRYTQDNQTPVAEMAVQIDGLRPDDPPGQVKVVGFGNLAQDLQNRVQVGQRLVLEGRLRMNTVNRPDGTKEKRAEFTLSRLHPLGGAGGMGGGGGNVVPAMAPAPVPVSAPVGAPRAAAPVRQPVRQSPPPAAPAPATPTWNSAPLVPDTQEEDDIPF